MRVQPSVRPRCKNCHVIRRKGRLHVICTTKKHKQRQG